jgi:hypothetical protein
MRRARYAGVGKLCDERWGSDLSWHCDAYWPDDAAPSPTVIAVSIKAEVLGAALRDVCLNRFEGLSGSRSSFTAEDWVRGTGFNQRSAKMNVTLRHEGFAGSQLALSGTWREKSHSGETTRAFTLQGDLVETGVGDPSCFEAAAVPEVKCNVQHIAHPLEELLKKLSEGKSLSDVEAGNFER